MKQTVTLLLLFSSLFSSAQTIADFENFDLAPNSFLDGSVSIGGFSSGAVFLPNEYNEEWASWSGWAISNTTDITTPGFSNQYSAIAGNGATGSATYAVSFISGESILYPYNAETITGLFVTNSTYAYLSMLEGDDFAKKFGGATGDDPDFFLLTIQKYLDGALSEERVEFYLADYRFEDNSQDYIIDDWTYVDLSALGKADSLSITLSSSDNGQFGMNTPAYFCVDNVTTGTTPFVEDENTAGFEEYEIATTSFLNGSDGNGGFASANVFLPNSYNPEWDSWSGWAITNTTDTTTPGFTNQYSSISGDGVNNSANYAVSFVSGESIIKSTIPSLELLIEGLYINNSTYAYLSMLEGDDFSKKFGGATGDDPDFFLLTIKRYKNGILRADSVNFYLADYRFEDNSQDYIVKDWTYVELPSLSGADSLSFTLSSSDNGQFGMNTPAYFCVDNIQAELAIVSVDFVSTEELFEVYPNPTADFIQFNSLSNQPTQIAIYSMTGQMVFSSLVTGNELLNIRHLSRGTYMIHVQNEEMQASQLLIKQ